MMKIRFCFLYGKCHLITIDENLMTFQRFIQIIEQILPPFRELDDYLYAVSGKPPHLLDLHSEQLFNQNQELITTGSYIWIKLK